MILVVTIKFVAIRWRTSVATTYTESIERDTAAQYLTSDTHVIPKTRYIMITRLTNNMTV